MALTPVYPSQVLFRFLTRRCGLPASATIPDTFTLTQNPIQLGVQIGTLEFNDSALALTDPASISSPTNQATLQTLVQQFTQDFLNWFQTQEDIVFAGVINLAPTAIIQTIEIEYNQGVCLTRISSQPDAFTLSQLSHQDPAVYSSCPDTDDNNAAIPCVKRYGPPSTNQADNSTSFDEYLICFNDGRLNYKWLQTVTYPCGCTQTNTCCFACESPCNLLKQNLTLNWTNLIIGNGSTTLSYQGNNTWISSCTNGLLYELLCNSGSLEFRVIYFTTAACPNGTQQYCSNLRSDPYGLTLANYTCNPLSIVFESRSNTCPTITNSGYTSFTISGPSVGPGSHCCIQVCVPSCMTAYGPFTVSVSNSSGSVATGVIPANSQCVNLDVGNPGNYNVRITGSNNLNLILKNENLKCCQLFMPPIQCIIINIIDICGNFYTCGASITINGSNGTTFVIGSIGNSGISTFCFVYSVPGPITIIVVPEGFSQFTNTFTPSDSCVSVTMSAATVIFSQPNGAVVGMLTDAAGTWPVTIYQATAFDPFQLNVCYMYSGANPMCGVNTTTPILYQIICSNRTLLPCAGDAKHYAITRYWSTDIGIGGDGLAYSGPLPSPIGGPHPCAKKSGECDVSIVTANCSACGNIEFNECDGSASGDINVNENNPNQCLPDPVGGGITFNFIL